MTDPKIVTYIDEHYVKAGDIQVKDIRDYGEYTVSIPVYNASAEFAKEAVAVFHLNFSRIGDEITLHDLPEHLLTDQDRLLISKTIADFLHAKELPSVIFREALLHRQQNPFDKQNIYFAWRKPDDTLFMVGLESYQINHIMMYEYDTYFKDYNVKIHNIDPLAAHMRGPQKFDPLEELVSRISKYEYLGSWENPELFRDSEDGKVAAYGQWELAKAHICGEATNDSLDVKIDSARAQRSQNAVSGKDIAEIEFEH